MTHSIRYQVRELEKEVRLMRRLAEPFLRSDSLGVLDELLLQLQSLEYRTGPLRLEVTPSWPIRTIECNGGYERDEGGKHKSLHAELALVWEFRPLGQSSKKARGHRLVEVAGKASTVATLHVTHSEGSSRLASWRMEFGDDESPGAHFHVQIPDTLTSGSDSDAPLEEFQMWPAWLPVPRLPIPAFTPMLALEYVLAEIFQDRWPDHLASGLYEIGEWRNLQRRRLSAYFRWQHSNSDSEDALSPLVEVMNAKPPPDLFLN